MTPFVAVLALLVLGWFAGGTIWNVRKGRELLRWMQGGLPLLGERTTLRWLGSTAVELGIQQARAPFTEVTLVVFLEPRDLPWMWALGRAGGRRDTLIVRGALRRAPSLELDALDPASWSGKDARRSLGGDGWSVREPARPGELQTWHRSEAALRRADELVEQAGRAGLQVRRLAVRRAGAQLQLHLGLPAADAPAGAFFEAVRSLAERAHA